jgi:hypothetical protein
MYVLPAYPVCCDSRTDCNHHQEPKAKNKGLVTLNESSVLAEIARLGEDMITAIVKQT